MYNAKDIEQKLVDVNINTAKLLQALKPHKLEQNDHEQIYLHYREVIKNISAFSNALSPIFELQRSLSDYLVREHQEARFQTGLYKTATDSNCNAVLDVKIERELDPETGEIIPAKGVYVHPETGEQLQPEIGVPAPTDGEVLAAVEKIQREGIFK